MSKGGMMGGGTGRHGRMAHGKPSNTKGTIKRLFSYMGSDKYKVFFVFACVLISSVCTLLGSYLLSPIIDGLSDNLKKIKAAPAVLTNSLIQEASFALLRGLLLMLAVFAFAVITSYLQQRIMIGVSQRAVVRVRKELFDHIQDLPLKYFDTHNTGEVMSRFTNDVDAIGEMMNNTVVQLFSGAISIVGTISFMIYLNPWLTLITVVMIPLMIKAGGTIAKRSRKYYSAQQEALGELNGYIEETVSGQKVIKVFCHEDETVEGFNERNTTLRGRQIKAQFFGGIMGPVMGNIGQLSYAFTAGIGAIFCTLGSFTVGGLTVFVNYSRQFSRPINEVAMQVNTIFAALAGAERVFAVMDETVEPEDSEDAITLGEVKGEVVLKDVTFAYNPDKIILKDINVYAKPGQKVAFVGSTGAGKTTITNLLNRFYDIAEGTITIDGKELRTIKRKNLRQNIAMVLQDTHLFTGTVRDNIRYGRTDATDEEIEAAAKVASAHSFIMRLSDGYDTVLEGDGTNLSQGQRQLLNIARAAVSHAPILVLDEATSSVDTRTEMHIDHGMERLMKNRTTFVIAHRLSTVRNADVIMVLEQGEIIERGTHDELLAQKGRYYQLYTGAIELD